VKINVGKIAELADKCDATLNHNYTRVRVEDQLGLQRVNWQVYKTFEENGLLLLLTAMDEDELAGFALYVMCVHPNHPEAKIGYCQFLIVAPAWRGKGLGRTLIESAMAELRRHGCTHIIHNRRMVYDIVPLFTKLGFEKFEESYIKELN
jgi:GNAT superfamily N-acetyltransferase